MGSVVLLVGWIRPHFRCCLPCRLWILLLRLHGSFVCPFCWIATGDGSVLVVLHMRRFLLSKLLIGVRCWYGSIAFGVGFGHSERGGFVSCAPLFGALCW